MLTGTEHPTRKPSEQKSQRALLCFPVGKCDGDHTVFKSLNELYHSLSQVHNEKALHGCLSVFGINTTVGVEHARLILLMCRNYCRLLEGSSMLDPYNEHHPETGYALNRLIQ